MGIIHRIKDYQDIRKIGFNYINMNLSVSIIIVANIRLCGLPFLRGFYSKDIIIEIVIIKGKRFFLFFLLMIGTGLTVIYSCRLNFLISLNFIKIESFYNISENSNLIILGIIFFVLILIIRSVYFCVYVYNNIQSLSKNIYIWFFSNIRFIPYSFNMSLRHLTLNYSVSFFKYIEVI